MLNKFWKHLSPILCQSQSKRLKNTCIMHLRIRSKISMKGNKWNVVFGWNVIFLFLNEPFPFVYFRLFKQTLTFCNKYMWKNVHPVYGAGIRIHNLQDMSLSIKRNFSLSSFASLFQLRCSSKGLFSSREPNSINFMQSKKLEETDKRF